MCAEIHPGSGELCVLLDIHTGLHETEEDDYWGCDTSGEHQFYAIEGQHWPATHCLCCGTPYNYVHKPERKKRVRRKP